MCVVVQNMMNDYYLLVLVHSADKYNQWNELNKQTCNLSKRKGKQWKKENETEIMKTDETKIRKKSKFTKRLVRLIIITTTADWFNLPINVSLLHGKLLYESNHRVSIAFHLLAVQRKRANLNGAVINNKLISRLELKMKRA